MVLLLQGMAPKEGRQIAILIPVRPCLVQSDARDWRRWCRVSLWDPGTPLLVTAPSGGLVLGPVCCGSLPLWAFLNYEL